MPYIWPRRIASASQGETLQSSSRWAIALESLAILSIVAVAILFHAPLVRDGLLLADPTANELASAPVMAQPDAATEHPFLFRYFPWFRFLSESLQRNDSLLWYPLEGCGLPFFALWETRLLSPFTIPFYMFPLESAFAWSFLLKMAVAGLAAYTAARAFRIPVAIALFVAVAFQTNPLFLASPFRPEADVIAWAPLWLMFTSASSGLSTMRLLQGAIIAALMLLGGSPLAILAILLVGIALPVTQHFLTSQRRSPLLPELALHGAAFVLGISLCAVQLIPYIEFLRNGDPAHTFPTSSGLVYLFPGGVLTALLALWVSLRVTLERDKRKSADTVFAAWMGVAVIGLATLWTTHLGIWLEILQPLALFLLLIASGIAAREWLSLNPEQTRRAISRLFPTILIVVIAIGVMLLFHINILRKAGNTLVMTSFVEGGYLVATLGLLLVTLMRPRATIIGLPLTVFVLVDAVFNVAAYRHVKTLDDVPHRTAPIAAMEQLGMRIGGNESLRNAPLAAHGLAQVYASSRATLDRTRDFLRRTRSHPALQLRAAPGALVLRRADFAASMGGMRPQLRLVSVMPNGAGLFARLQPIGRVRMANVVTTSSGNVPVPGSERPPVVEDMVPNFPVAADDVLSEITELSNTRLSIHVPETAPGTLIVADAFYPGWRAEVNGKPEPVVPVDRMLRAVTVRRGEHEVVMEYRPDSVTRGKWISGLTLVGCGVGYVVLRRRRQSPDSVDG